MHISVKCMQPTIFNWCEGVVSNLKGKLTRVKTEKLNFFGYGAFVISFSLERIPFLAPQVPIDGGGPQDTRMLKWVTLMARHGGGEGPMIRYTHDLFVWLEHQIIMIEDFLYASIDCTCDPDIPLPIGMQCSDLGKNFTFWLFVILFFVFSHP